MLRNLVSYTWPYCYLVWQLIFFAVPVILLFWLSLGFSSNGLAAIGLDNYAILLSTSRYRTAIANSLQLGLMAGAGAVVFGLPLAYAIERFVSRSSRRWCLLGLMLPFFSSYVLRVYGWQAWMNNNGIVVWLAKEVLGIEGASGLLYSRGATLAGLLSLLLPIATLLIYLSLTRIDPVLISVANNLGASPWTCFLRIELPLALPALLVAFLFCLLLAFGDFICVTILGGNQTYYYSIAIQDQMKIDNWPMAAALGAVLLAMSVAFMAITFTLVSRTGAGGRMMRLRLGR